MAALMCVAALKCGIRYAPHSSRACGARHLPLVGGRPENGLWPPRALFKFTLMSEEGELGRAKRGSDGGVRMIGIDMRGNLQTRNPLRPPFVTRLRRARVL